MSKSAGNGIDPLEVVDIYGADAMRFTLSFMAAQGQDILINMDSFKMGSRFCNKIWNAARFILMNLEGAELLDVDRSRFTAMDRWIFHRLSEAAGQTAAAFSSFRFNDASQTVYEFFWNDVCDWYIEASKPSLYSSDADERNRCVSVLLEVLKQSMSLLHPFVPFITEEIYQKLPNTEGLVIEAPYPVYRKEDIDAANADAASRMQEAVRGIRTLRSEFTIPPEKKIKAVIRTEPGFPAAAFFQQHRSLIASFVNAESLEIAEHIDDAAGSVPVSGIGYEALVYVRDSIDVEKETAKLKKEQKQLSSQLKSVQGKLSNDAFLSRAPASVIEKEQGKQQEFEERLEKISRYLSDLA